MQPTVFAGENSMRIFQEEIFGPVVSVTSFTDYDDAIRIANDTLYGLGAGVGAATATPPTGPGATSRPAGWDQLLSHVPAHAAFGGYKQSGIGRRTT